MGLTRDYEAVFFQIREIEFDDQLNLVDANLLFYTYFALINNFYLFIFCPKPIKNEIHLYLGDIYIIKQITRRSRHLQLRGLWLLMLEKLKKDYKFLKTNCASSFWTDLEIILNKRY